MNKICGNRTLSDYASLGLTMGACYTASTAYYGAVKAAGADAFKSSGPFCEYDGPADTCSASTPNSESCWTGKFSEEGSGEKLCPAGRALAGVWCTGGYCDNFNLLCSPLKNIRNQQDTKWISEEQPNASFRVDGGSTPAVIVGLKCSGGYCDNVKGIVGTALDKKRTGQWRWTNWISEEQGWVKCESDEFVTGVGCKGAYCDNVSLHCSKFTEE